MSTHTLGKECVGTRVQLDMDVFRPIPGTLNLPADVHLPLFRLPGFPLLRFFRRVAMLPTYALPALKVEDEDAFDDEVDTLKFRLVLRPETDENNEASVDTASPVPGTVVAENAAASSSSGSALPLHRLMIQTVGGRTCSQVRGSLLLLSFVVVVVACVVVAAVVVAACVLAWSHSIWRQSTPVGRFLACQSESTRKT